MSLRPRPVDPGQPKSRLLFYRAVRYATALALTVLYAHRRFGVERVPAEGPLILVSNHQSHLDPPLVGVSMTHRHIVPLARMGLFKNRFFAWLILMLNSIPLRENESDAAAIRKAIQELGKGRAILIFPEGSRSPDGGPQPYKRGMWLLMSRAKCPVVPVGIEGAYDAWPRHRLLPNPFRCRTVVVFGDPIAPERLRELGPDRGLATIASEVDALRRQGRDYLRRATHGSLPRPGGVDKEFRYEPADAGAEPATRTSGPRRQTAAG